MTEHKTQIDGFASLADLAEKIGDLRYDAFAQFLNHLETKLMRDSDADLARERSRLSLCLHRARWRVGEARVEIEQAWKISKPFMRLETP